MTLSINKAALQAYTEACRHPAEDGYTAATDAFFAQDAIINVVHPFNEVGGPEGYRKNFIEPLQASFGKLYRTAYIAFAGSFDGSDWVTCTGHYAGKFTAPWLNIQPTGNLEYIRYGEFHRMENGRAVESYVFLDIPALMIAAGQWPIKGSVGAESGYTGFLPGPATQDGQQWQTNDPARSASSLELMQSMLHGLATEDEAWRAYWHEDMMWHGPAAFGAFVGIEDFAGFQVPFESTFSEWVSGIKNDGNSRHFCRMADGDYICIAGWPSLNAVQARTFLDQPSKGERLYMRVCDWWRREGDLLAENWIFVDVPHVLLQMGYDLFGNLEEKAA